MPGDLAAASDREDERGDDNDSGSGSRPSEQAEGSEDGGGDGYTHRPGSDADPADRGYVRPHQAPPSDSPFGWRGWLLVGVIIFCLIVVPAAILYLPQAQGVVASLGLTLRDAYLVLPLVPAFLLGAVAVWVAVKSR
jgi:hypothetical protein